VADHDLMVQRSRGRGRRLSIPRILVGISALVGVVVVLLRLPELVGAVGSLASLGPVVVPTGLALAALGAMARASQTRSTSQLVGLESTWRRDVEVSATAYATNKVVKSGGFAGLVHHLADADRRGYHRPSVTAAYLASKVADTIAFSVLVVVAMGAAWAFGALHGAELVASVVTLAYAGVLVIGLVALARSPERARRGAHRVRALLTRRTVADQADGRATVDEVSRVLVAARDDRARARQVLVSALAAKLVGFVTLFLVVDALGLAVGLVPLGAIYVLGLAAAMAGPLPGGLGATEASMTVLLVAAGAGSVPAAAAVVAFRLFDFWVPTAIGLALGARSARPREEISLSSA
jgi:uncharacterized protein (TIRG00374 family)